MHRFHFDLIDGRTLVRDDEGVEAEDLSCALEQARATIEEMRASGDLSDLAGRWQLVVRSESGTVLASISLPELH
ncbi:DUF6894 family protein [Methylobacterium crusticola]|uniref:DUF6894 family protein n=1 Tax=Methylobacterium crusticola TaxID=1697972 RepID=UPI000FFBC9AA|nr:hypothetical protein [Methylobacterium crusticola]